jgi:hypothetical protein
MGEAWLSQASCCDNTRPGCCRLSWVLLLMSVVVAVAECLYFIADVGYYR